MEGLSVNGELIVPPGNGASRGGPVRVFVLPSTAGSCTASPMFLKSDKHREQRPRLASGYTAPWQGPYNRSSDRSLPQLVWLLQ